MPKYILKCSGSDLKENEKQASSLADADQIKADHEKKNIDHTVNFVMVSESNLFKNTYNYLRYVFGYKSV